MANKLMVEFIEVGPRKLSWSADVLSPLTFHGLMREIRKHKALGSKDVEFNFETEVGGSIYVGGFRRVGHFKVSERTADAAVSRGQMSERGTVGH